MFDQTRIVEIFPTPVWVYKLNAADVERLSAPLFAKIERLREATGTVRPGSPWQTRNDLQEDPDFEDLVAVIREATTQTLNSLEIAYDSFLITGLWANIRPKGGMHRPHTHPNNYLSGVYYLKAPQGGNTLMFHEPRTQLRTISPRVMRHNKFNTEQTLVTVETGVLVMFPAWLAHSVVPNQSDEDRISLSFNIMFTKFGETMGQPLWEGA